MADEILTETHGRVRLITLNRPEAKNSVNSALGLALVAVQVGAAGGLLTDSGNTDEHGNDSRGDITEDIAKAKGAQHENQTASRRRR